MFNEKYFVFKEMKMYTCLLPRPKTSYVWTSKGSLVKSLTPSIRNFSVGSESEKYKLTVGGYSGNAGERSNHSFKDRK